MPRYELVPFNLDDAVMVSSWLLDADDVVMFTGERLYPVQPADVILWSRDATCTYLLLSNAEPIGYGEIVEDDADGDIEIGRMILAPGRRKGEAGSVLLAMLCDLVSREFPYEQVWLRVGRLNARALSNGLGNGFVEDPDTSGQNFIWLRKQLCH